MGCTQLDQVLRSCSDYSLEQQGCCQADDYELAVAQGKLNNIFRTRFCPFTLRGQPCAQVVLCPYAHCLSELRINAALEVGAVKSDFKKVLCTRGSYCRLGLVCPNLHSKQEKMLVAHIRRRGSSPQRVDRSLPPILEDWCHKIQKICNNLEAEIKSPRTPRNQNTVAANSVKGDITPTSPKLTPRSTTGTFIKCLNAGPRQQSELPSQNEGHMTNLCHQKMRLNPNQAGDNKSQLINQCQFFSVAEVLPSHLYENEISRSNSNISDSCCCQVQFNDINQQQFYFDAKQYQFNQDNILKQQQQQQQSSHACIQDLGEYLDMGRYTKLLSALKTTEKQEYQKLLQINNNNENFDDKSRYNCFFQHLYQDYLFQKDCFARQQYQKQLQQQLQLRSQQYESSINFDEFLDTKCSAQVLSALVISDIQDYNKLQCNGFLLNQQQQQQNQQQFGNENEQNQGEFLDMACCGKVISALEAAEKLENSQKQLEMNQSNILEEHSFFQVPQQSRFLQFCHQ